MSEPVKTYVCQECGQVQTSPAPCEACGCNALEVLEGPSRAKAIMPPARPL